MDATLRRAGVERKGRTAGAAAFSARTEALLDRAEAICGARGARLTELRRLVLGLILEAPAPSGAYDLLDRLRGSRAGAAPPTVYRALEFLLENGLIHRLERLAAFVGCIAHDHGGAAGHAAQFLICRGCGLVAELDDHDLAQALAVAARRLGFAVRGATIEAEGLCAACAANGSPPTAAPPRAASPG